MNPWKWLLAIPMIISFLVFTIAIFAETNRLPFDLPEAETGAGRRLSHRIQLDEVRAFFPRRIRRDDHRVRHYRDVISRRLAFSRAYPDGSHGWIFGLVNIAVFFAKVAVVIFVFIWVRWTLPAFRYDQLMRLGWVFFFEIALVNIFIVAAILAYCPRL